MFVGGGCSGTYDWTAPAGNNFDAIKNRSGGYTQSGRAPVFHLSISVHNHGCSTNNSSGLSRGATPTDSIISLGSYLNTTVDANNNVIILSTEGGTVNQQAGTFMHELGHCLGLDHGGER